MKGVLGKSLALFVILAIIAVIAAVTVVQITFTSKEAPLRGIIVGVFGYLPEECSVLDTQECRSCLLTEKIVPLIANSFITFTIISTVFLAAARQDVIPSLVAGISLMSIATAILSLHLNISLIFMGEALFNLAVGFVFIISIFHFLFETQLRNEIRNLLITGIITYLIINGSTVLFDALNFIGKIFGALISGQPLEIPEWRGITPYVIENLGLPKVDCSENKLGPEEIL